MKFILHIFALLLCAPSLSMSMDLQDNDPGSTSGEYNETHASAENGIPDSRYLMAQDLPYVKVDDEKIITRGLYALYRDALTADFNNDPMKHRKFIQHILDHSIDFYLLMSIRQRSVSLAALQELHNNRTITASQKVDILQQNCDLDRRLSSDERSCISLMNAKTVVDAQTIIEDWPDHDNKDLFVYAPTFLAKTIIINRELMNLYQPSSDIRQAFDKHMQELLKVIVLLLENHTPPLAYCAPNNCLLNELFLYLTLKDRQSSFESNAKCKEHFQAMKKIFDVLEEAIYIDNPWLQHTDHPLLTFFTTNAITKSDQNVLGILLRYARAYGIEVIINSILPFLNNTQNLQPARLLKQEYDKRAQEFIALFKK